VVLKPQASKKPGKIRTLYNKYAEYYRISGAGSVMRRYFALNFFDGVLTVLGILLSSLFFRAESALLVKTACIGAAVALGVSGVWGAYFAEGAERRLKIHKLEKAVLHKLDHTDIDAAEKFATKLIAIVNGLTPVIAALITISPFIFAPNAALHSLYIVSIGFAFVLLFLLGAYLGVISEEDAIMSGFKLLIAGIVCAVVLFLVGKI